MIVSTMKRKKKKTDNTQKFNAKRVINYSPFNASVKSFDAGQPDIYTETFHCSSIFYKQPRTSVPLN